jgi:hypothetical protein
VSVGISGQHDGAMTEAFRHCFERQLQPAVAPTVDAPARKEVAKGMDAGILRLGFYGVRIDDEIGTALRRPARRRRWPPTPAVP